MAIKPGILGNLPMFFGEERQRWNIFHSWMLIHDHFKLNHSWPITKWLSAMILQAFQAFWDGHNSKKTNYHGFPLHGTITMVSQISLSQSWIPWKRRKLYHTLPYYFPHLTAIIRVIGSDYFATISSTSSSSIWPKYQRLILHFKSYTYNIGVYVMWLCTYIHTYIHIYKYTFIS